MRSQSSGDTVPNAPVTIKELVSIADAKPILWRHASTTSTPMQVHRFNRRCEANPLATLRRIAVQIRLCGFQSQMRSQSSGDMTRAAIDELLFMFQSQMRSQSSGDLKTISGAGYFFNVSIADAKPILWRRSIPRHSERISLGFNRRCEANPLATCPQRIA